MVRSAPSFRLRQNAPQKAKDRKETKKIVKQPTQSKPQPPQTNESSSLLFPGGETAFKALLSARFCAAIWLHVTDCDETFNYWEPMHYLVFGKGFQTWEYSPEYALRSYTYIMFYAVPAYIYHKILQPNPLLIFYFTRCVLGLIASFVEVYFYKAVCREFGVHIGRLCLIFQLFSAGMFIASTAFLPSTFAMYMFVCACSAWWRQQYALAVFFTALGSLLGWPFAALLGLPIVFDMIFRKKLYLDFFTWSLISAVVILLPMVTLDSLYYGRLVIAPLNIVKYNVLGGAGPELYGIEPFSFYIMNGFLNFNFIWVLALLSPIAITLAFFFVPAKGKSTLSLPYWLSLSPMYLWLLVFLFQPHKEERFLFPIYPMICLCGAITLDVFQKLFFRCWGLIQSMPYGTHYLDKTMFIVVITLITTSLLGVSRIFALYRNYHAPLDLLMELNKFPMDGKISEKTAINLCVGKDWYRYPSSFFLPNTADWNVKFVKSEFDGMLPAPYFPGDNGTQIVHEYFNDQNKGDPSLLFDVNKCHFMLDLDLGVESEHEPIYANDRERWRVVGNYPFLNARKSNRFFRAFYIPFVSDIFVTYGNFSLLRSKVKIK